MYGPPVSSRLGVLLRRRRSGRRRGRGGRAAQLGVHLQRLRAAAVRARPVEAAHHPLVRFVSVLLDGDRVRRRGIDLVAHERRVPQLPAVDQHLGARRRRGDLQDRRGRARARRLPVCRPASPRRLSPAPACSAAGFSAAGFSAAGFVLGGGLARRRRSPRRRRSRLPPCGAGTCACRRALRSSPAQPRRPSASCRRRASFQRRPSRALPFRRLAGAFSSGARLLRRRRGDGGSAARTLRRGRRRGRRGCGAACARRGAGAAAAPRRVGARSALERTDP